MSTFTDAISQLKAAQKSSRGAPAYSRFVNRPVGRVLAAGAYSVGMSPNAVTMVSGAVTLTGIAMIALLRPTWWSSLLVTALLVLGYALDSADGQVARLLKKSSMAGEWLDHMMDSLKLATMHLAVLVCWFRFFDLDRAWLLVPLLWQVVACVFFFGFILTDQLRRMAATSAGASAPSAVASSAPQSRWYSLAVMPTDYGLHCLMFLVLWVQPLFVAVYTALALLNTLILATVVLRWFRSVKALDGG